MCKSCLRHTTIIQTIVFERFSELRNENARVDAKANDAFLNELKARHIITHKCEQGFSKQTFRLTEYSYYANT